MKIIDINHIPEFHNRTKSIEQLGALLGQKANVLAEVVKLRRDLTFSVLTDGLNRVYSSERKAGYQESDSFMFEWRIESNYIPRIVIVEDCSDTGQNRTPIILFLEKNYYSKYDTFALEDPRYQLFIIQEPEKIADNRWRYICTLSGNDLNAKVDPNLVRKGRKTVYHSNYHPEGSHFGSSKLMFNTEKHRGWISTHRVADAVTGDFNAQVYFEAKGKNGESRYFSMSKPEKNLLDQFLTAREHSNLFNRDNHDLTGRCLDYDPNGHPIHRGDGIIPQIERYCDKFFYNTLTTTVFEDAINSVVRRTGNTTGNNITVVCNWVGFLQAQKAMEDRLRNFAIDGAYYYSAKAGREVDMGATYRSYNYAGNTITFAEDRALSEHIDDRGYMIFIDTGINDGKPNIAGFTIKGREMLRGTLNGMGGSDGKSSGDISSPVDGVQMHILGQSGIMVANPYAGFILQENRVRA
jgi:hypothetical protein